MLFRSSEGLGVALAGAEASTAGLSRQVEQPARRAPAGACQRQPTLDFHDAATARRRPATIQSVACDATGAAAIGASTLAGVQIAAARPATRGARILQSVPPDAAGKAPAIASAMASNDAGATAPRGTGHARGAAAASGSSLDLHTVKLSGPSAHDPVNITYPAGNCVPHERARPRDKRARRGILPD